ncbi:MAG TPA: radical SAM protein [Pseudobacteroides sp.]|uniref:radical SAM protein n=1 Tax=Pseudobacteroides sp. TaxID=1968840 RepID=UPI002F94387C
MKASRYNFFWTLNDDVKIAFNSLTCALAQIDDEFINIIDNIEDIEHENLEEDKKKLIDEMLRGNYILTDDVDELKLVEYRMNEGKYHDYGLFLTIAPTLECNFKCPYCYEYPTAGKMSDETKNAILSWITAVAAKKGDIHVTWYGGEPLIASETIFDFSRKAIKICEESNVKYHAGMVTNGYLLNDEIIEQLISSNVNSVQITLDGPPNIHNKRRILKLNGEGTFDVLLSNIKKLKAKNILCNIRMNVDNENSSFVKDLLDILKENNLQDLPLSLGKVTSYTDACDHIAESCMHTKQFSEININTLKLLLQNRFRVNDRMLYPNIIGNYCGATQMSSYVIDPKGYIYINVGMMRV